MLKTYVSNYKKFRPLLYELVARDIKVKYRRSVLGLLWTVLNPLLMMVVLTIVFSSFFKQDIDNFPVYLLCGNIIFSFFSEATTIAMSSILNSSSLIKKVYVPKYLFVVAKVVSSFVNLLSSSIALIIVIIVTRTPVKLTVFQAIFPILYVFIFAMGMSFLLSTLVVFMRDFLHLYAVILTVWTYLTPIFYPTTILPGWVKPIIKCNPIASFVELFRDSVLYGEIGSIELHARCIVPCIIMVLVGFIAFIKNQDKFVLKV